MSARTTAKEVMEIMLESAEKYSANMNPDDGIIKFIFPKEDVDNPLGRNVMIEIDIKNERLRLTEIRQ